MEYQLIRESQREHMREDGILLWRNKRHVPAGFRDKVGKKHGGHRAKGATQRCH